MIRQYHGNIGDGVWCFSCGTHIRKTDDAFEQDDGDGEGNIYCKDCVRKCSCHDGNLNGRTCPQCGGSGLVRRYR